MDSTQPGGELPPDSSCVLCAHPVGLIGDALVRLFTLEGLSVSQAEGSDAAWDAFCRDSGGLSAVVVAHELPGGGGLGLVRRLREAGFGGRIIAHGPEVNDDDIASYRGWNVESVVVTSSGPEELLGVVEAWCTGPRGSGSTN